MNFDSFAAFYDDLILNGWMLSITRNVWELQKSGSSFSYDMMQAPLSKRMPATFIQEFLKWYGKNAPGSYHG